MSSAEGAPTNGCWTHIDGYAFATTVCPFYTLEEPDAAGGVSTVIRPRGSGPCAALHMA